MYLFIWEARPEVAAAPIRAAMSLVVLEAGPAFPVMASLILGARYRVPT